MWLGESFRGKNVWERERERESERERDREREREEEEEQEEEEEEHGKILYFVLCNGEWLSSPLFLLVCIDL